MTKLKSLEKLFEGRHRFSCLRTTIALKIHCLNLRYAPGQVQSNSRDVHDERSLVVGIAACPHRYKLSRLGEGRSLNQSRSKPAKEPIHQWPCQRQ
jgi:hypothetical protein